MSNTIPLPEPIAWLFRTLPAGGSWELALSDDAGKPPWNARSEKPLYTADQMHAHAAAVSAAKDARIKVLEDALRMALAELDELPVWSNTGHVCNIARAALGDKTCSG